MEPVNTTNDFFIGTHGDSLVVLRPIQGRLSKEEALRAAAWMVALADPLDERFQAVLDAVRSI